MGSTGPGFHVSCGILVLLFAGGAYYRGFIFCHQNEVAMNRKTKVIVERLFTSKEFDALFYNLHPDEYLDDIKMEVILILCELSDEKIRKIYNDDALINYVKKIVHNGISQTGTIRKKYQPKKVSSVLPLLTPDELSERMIDERLEEAICNFYRCLHWRDVAVFDLYMEYGSFRDAANAVGMPYATLFKWFNEAKQIIISIMLKDKSLMPKFRKNKDRQRFYCKMNKIIFPTLRRAPLCE